MNPITREHLQYANETSPEPMSHAHLPSTVLGLRECFVIATAEIHTIPLLL